MKLFLLIAGSKYYPSYDTDDWIDTYLTREEAEKEVVKLYDLSGNQRGYKIKGINYDWYCIVDLRDWVSGQVFDGRIK